MIKSIINLFQRDKRERKKEERMETTVNDECPEVKTCVEFTRKGPKTIEDEGNIRVVEKFSICTSSKLTRADAGKISEFNHDVWVKAKITKPSDLNEETKVDLDIHEQTNAKLIQANTSASAG